MYRYGRGRLWKSIIRTGILGTQHSHTEGKLAAMRGFPADYEVLRVCEPDPEARAKAEKHAMFKGLQWSSEEELLGDKSLDLIVVECRPWEAIPFGNKVIAAGKHLHIEKPPGNKFPPFRELVEADRFVLPRLHALRERLLRRQMQNTQPYPDFLYWSREKIARKVVLSLTHVAFDAPAELAGAEPADASVLRDRADHPGRE